MKVGSRGTASEFDVRCGFYPQMNFKHLPPFPIISFFACCSDIIVVVGCIFTKTKTNIKNEDVPSIPRLVSLAQEDQLIFFLSFLSMQRSHWLSTQLFFHLQLWADVSCHFLFPCIFILFFSQGYTALEGLRWSVSVLGPVILWTEAWLASRGIRH